MLEKFKSGLESAVAVTGDKVNEAAVWWRKYRVENPNTDKAVLKIGETLEDIQQRLGDIGDNVTGTKVLEQASALIDQQKKYNDVLATRLSEALDEIKLLKTRVVSLEESR
jgi:UDP-N-acetylmuramoylalanine-D-glutamate ligase